nr:nuclear transport factor 2 family protein [Brevundimonas sp. Root1423]
MTGDEVAIRALIDRWAKAVHAGDMEGVLADHAGDIVMFDVPPPNEVRGKAAYRDTWPPFFEYQKRAVFEIVTLDVTAGSDVAFAHALLPLRDRGRVSPRPRQPAAAHHRLAQGGRPLDRRP